MYFQLCRWSADLELELKQEYYTDIWSLEVDTDETVVYTAKDNEIVLGDIARVIYVDLNKDRYKYGRACSVPVVQFQFETPVEFQFQAQLVSTGFNWFQLVSTGLNWFLCR